MYKLLSTDTRGGQFLSSESIELEWHLYIYDKIGKCYHKVPPGTEGLWKGSAAPAAISHRYSRQWASPHRRSSALFKIRVASILGIHHCESMLFTHRKWRWQVARHKKGKGTWCILEIKHQWAPTLTLCYWRPCVRCSQGLRRDFNHV